MNPERLLLPILNKVQMATIYHFQPWICRKSNNFKGSLSSSTRQIIKLIKEGLIQRVQIHPHIRSTYRYNTFYSLKPDKIANREIEHQSGLIDVLLAFIYLYRDYEIDIEYIPRLRAGGVIYRPDAIVKMTGINGHKYDFIIEFERSRSPQAILKEKLHKNEQMPAFKSMGLSEQTKILYIFSHENHNVFLRPNQYHLPEAQAPIQALNSGFANLCKIVKDQWLKPNHQEFAPRNAWSFYNACTEALKTCPPVTIMEKHIQLHRAFQPLLEGSCIGS